MLNKLCLRLSTKTICSISGDVPILILLISIIFFPSESSTKVMEPPSNVCKVDVLRHIPRATAIKIPLLFTSRGLDAYLHQQI